MAFLLTCNNQRLQRSQFFFYEGKNNIRFSVTSPYVSDSNGKLLYTPAELDMRRKAEILKYIKPSESNVSKNKYSLLARQSNKQMNRITCNSNISVPTSSSDVPGTVINLKEDPDVPLYKYFSDLQQFKFQDIKYDEFKRFYDLFPVYNNDAVNNNYSVVNTIVILRPRTTELDFNFSFPICINYKADFTTDPSPAGISNVNIGIYSASLDIFYSNTLIKTVNANYRNPDGEELPEDIAQSTVTISADLKESEDGTISINRYVGNIIFPNIVLASVSQHVYTCKLKISLSYGEYNETELTRNNTEGNDMGTSGEVNVKNVQFNPFINVDSEDNTNFDTIDNCEITMYTNKLPSPVNPTITNLPFVPLTITT